MPILEVAVVVGPGEAPPIDLARRVADAAGRVLESHPGGTWVKIDLVPVARYAENGAGPEPGVRPVFVKVIERAPPAGDALASRVAALAGAIAGAVGRLPENVHIIYEPPGAGRVAFGGKLVA